jgi:GTP cyclohydrolase IA
VSIDTGRIEAAVAEILAAIGEDPARPGLAETPRRVALACAELFAGVGEDADALLAEPVPADATGELVIVRDLAFRSVCEHHLLPFGGRAHVAYRPGAHLAGLGHLGRVVDSLARRPQLQERLGELIADTVHRALAARGVVVVLDAAHGCVRDRGIRQTESTTVTVAARGDFVDPAQRAEVIALLAASRSEVAA